MGKYSGWHQKSLAKGQTTLSVRVNVVDLVKVIWSLHERGIKVEGKSSAINCAVRAAAMVFDEECLRRDGKRMEIGVEEALEFLERNWPSRNVAKERADNLSRGAEIIGKLDKGYKDREGYSLPKSKVEEFPRYSEGHMEEVMESRKGERAGSFGDTQNREFKDYMRQFLAENPNLVKKN